MSRNVHRKYEVWLAYLRNVTDVIVPFSAAIDQINDACPWASLKERGVLRKAKMDFVNLRLRKWSAHRFATRLDEHQQALEVSIQVLDSLFGDFDIGRVYADFCLSNGGLIQGVDLSSFSIRGFSLIAVEEETLPEPVRERVDQHFERVVQAGDAAVFRRWRNVDRFIDGFTSVDSIAGNLSVEMCQMGLDAFRVFATTRRANDPLEEIDLRGV